MDVYGRPNLDKPIWDRVVELHNAVTNDPNHTGPDAVASRGAKLLHVSEGRTEWELTIEPRHCNKNGNLHGGTACTLLDNLTSTACLTIAKPGFLDGNHVSRTITMTYLRPVPKGSKVKITGEIVAAGRTTVHVKGDIMVNGKVCVTCIHDKVVIPRGAVHPNAKPKL